MALIVHKERRKEERRAAGRRLQWASPSLLRGLRHEGSWGDRSFDRAGFSLHEPLDNRIDRATYFARCWPNSASTAGFDFVHLVPHGNKVFATYEGRNTDGRRFRNTEILTVRNGLITDVEVYFGWSIPHAAQPGGFMESPP